MPHTPATRGRAAVFRAAVCYLAAMTDQAIAERVARHILAKRRAMTVLHRHSRLATILEHDAAADPKAVLIYFDDPEDANEFLSAITEMRE
jgi:adenosyl cobinamide kinase/adenosyl cobinamide phosphate guanylyltransferase